MSQEEKLKKEIEISEEYCKIARKRLAQEVLKL